MTKTFANIIRRLIAAAGILCIALGTMSATRTYSSLYAIASTGSSPIGVRLSDLPATIHLPLFTILLGFLLIELGELIWRRYMRSNNSFKPKPLRGSA